MEEEQNWDSDDSVCLMEDMDKQKSREMVLLKSVRMKPKLSRMGDELLLTGKDSAMTRSRRWVKDREAQLQRDQSDVPVRFKEIKNVGFTQHRFGRPVPPTAIDSRLSHSLFHQRERHEYRMEKPPQPHASTKDRQT